MSALAGLKLIAAKRPQAAAPIVQRRNKLSNQLFHQIELARCMAQGKTYAPTRPAFFHHAMLCTQDLAISARCAGCVGINQAGACAR